MASRSRGRWGEDRAAVYYRSIGFVVVDRNWRSDQREVPGEIDLVVRGDDVLVFCEVKARQRAGFGGAAQAVDRSKQSRVRALAEAWLLAHHAGDVDIRFDVIAIEGVALTHHASAF